METQTVGHADGIADFNHHPLSKSGSDGILRDITAHIQSASVYLRLVLAALAPAADTSEAAIAVNRDLTSSESGIPVGAADDENARRVDIEVEVVNIVRKQLLNLL